MWKRCFSSIEVDFGLSAGSLNIFFTLMGVFSSSGKVRRVRENLIFLTGFRFLVILILILNCFSLLSSFLFRSFLMIVCQLFQHKERTSL